MSEVSVVLLSLSLLSSSLVIYGGAVLVSEWGVLFFFLSRCCTGNDAKSLASVIECSVLSEVGVVFLSLLIVTCASAVVGSDGVVGCCFCMRAVSEGMTCAEKSSRVDAFCGILSHM